MESPPIKLIVPNQITIKGNGTNRISGIMLYESGTESQNIQFTLLAQQLPKGTMLEMNCDAKGPNPPIVLEPTKITMFPAFSTGIDVHVPSDFTGEINFSATCNSGVLGLNCELRMTAAYATAPVN